MPVLCKHHLEVLCTYVGSCIMTAYGIRLVKFWIINITPLPLCDNAGSLRLYYASLLSYGEGCWLTCVRSCHSHRLQEEECASSFVCESDTASAEPGEGSGWIIWLMGMQRINN